jgi:Mg2+ transporter MgtE
MIFLSALLRQSVYDSENRRMGVVRDVCVELKETFPVVTALIVHPVLGTGTHDTIIPWAQVQTIEDVRVPLTVPQSQIISYTPQKDELLLRRDLLDKQIVDTQGFRVVKINDLKLAQIKKTARLVGVDIGFSALLRRLGMEAPLDALGRVMRLQLSERTITWNYVEPIQMVRAGVSGQTGELAAVGAGAGTQTSTVANSGVVPQVQLNVSHNKLAELHPADIADILEQLDVEDAGAFLGSLDTETAADTLNEIETPLQSELLSEIDPERASDMLETMAPDDAADILAEMSHADAERLLNLMPANESKPIRDLLRYGAETAGGIMTNEVLALSQDTTVEEALTYMRTHSEHLEMVYYLYIIDAERHLLGVVSLRQLVTADPGKHMGELMDTDVIKVQADVDQEEVARRISKYDLLGIPVVDADNHLLGLITVDDVIDVLHEEQAEDISDIAGADVQESEDEEKFSWRTAINRSSWLGVNVIAGFILALVLTQVFSSLLRSSTALVSIANIALAMHSHIALNGVFCLVPMLLMTSGRMGSQALGVAGWRLRAYHGRDLWQSIGRELQLSTFGGVLASLLVVILMLFLFQNLLLSVGLGLGFGFTLLVAALCGLALPNILQRLQLRGSLISGPLLDPIIAIVSLSVFLVVTLGIIERLGV